MNEFVVEVTTDSFSEQVVERSRSVPVVVDFWAEWCGPCKVLGPVLERVIADRAGAVILAKIDIDRSPALAGQFGIRSVPTVVAFKDGAPISSFMGVQPEPELRRWLSEFVPTQEDDRAAATAFLEDAQPEVAEAGYREILEDDPIHEGAAVGLARILIKRGETDEAAALLGRVAPGTDQKDELERLQAAIALSELGGELPPLAELRAQVEGDPESAELRYRLGCALARSGDHAGALEELFAAGQRDRALAKAQVREAMVAVFNALGQQDPLTKQYRKQLALLLY